MTVVIQTIATVTHQLHPREPDVRPLLHAPLRSGRRGFDIHDPAPDDLSRVSLHEAFGIQFAREQGIHEGRGVQPIAVREDCARGQPEGL